MISFLQINVGRARVAHDVAEAVARRRGVDVILYQEPNKKISENQGVLTDTRTDTAIYCLNKPLGIKAHERLEGFSRTTFEGWDLYNCCLSANISLQDFKQKVDEIMWSVQKHGTGVIIAGDVNAKSYVGLTNGRSQGRV